MKVIDLLNKKANGEEMPKKIKYNGDIYEFKRNDYERTTPDFNVYTLLYDMEYIIKLNDEVEIIEENKEIEKLEVALLGQCDNWLVNPTTKTTKQDIELNPYIIENIRTNTLYFQRKINELIDEVNKLKGEIKNGN